jgi:CRISPR-associated endoribonuclease Cas6
VRIRIIFNLVNKGTSLPFQHQAVISGLIKTYVSQKEFSEFDLYSFSGLKGRTRVIPTGLQYNSEKVTLVLTSPNEAFLKSFLQGIFGKDFIQLGELVLKPLYVEKELPISLENEVKYLCISPLVILNPFDSPDPKQFINPEEDLFSDLLFDSILERVERSGLFNPNDTPDIHKFQLIPDKVYLTKIQQEKKKFSRIFSIMENGQSVEVRGYTFPFTLYAVPQIQNFVYDCGIGILTNHGLGMVDLSNTDFNTRTEPYNFS